MITLALAAAGPVEAWGQAPKRSRGPVGGEVVTAGAPAVLVNRDRPVHGLAFSPDGAILASVDGKTLRLWDAVTGQMLREYAVEVISTGPTFSPDGALLAAFVNVRDIGLWEVATGREVGQVPCSSFRASGPSFLPDGRTLLAVSGKTSTAVGLYDVTTRKELRALDEGPAPDCVAATADGRLAAVATSQEPRTAGFVREIVKPTVALVDLASGKYRPTLPGVDFETSGLALTPDGRRLIAGGARVTAAPNLDPKEVEGALKVWDVATGRLIAALPYGQTTVDPRSGAVRPLHGWIHCLALSPEGSTVATVGDGPGVDLWNVNTLERVGRIGDPDPIVSVGALAFSPDGQTLAYAEWDMRGGPGTSRIRLHVVPTGRGRGPTRAAPAAPAPTPDVPAEVASFKGHNAGTSGVAFSRDGRLVLSGGDDKVARLWEAGSGTEVTQFVGHSGSVNGVALGRDGKVALTGSDDKTARLWDVATGRELHRLDGHEGGITGVKLSPDGTKAATASWDRTARLWDVASGKELRACRGHEEGLIALAFAPDGRTLYTASWDRTARAWDVASGKELRVFRGHDDKAGHVAVSTDGRRLLTSGTDRTLRLWDAASTKELARVDTSADCGWAVALAPDSRHALTVDGADLTVWDLQTRTPPARLAVGDGQIRGLALSPDGRLAAVATEGGAAVHVWRLPRFGTSSPRR